MLGAQQKGDVADVVSQFRMPRGLGQHQVLHRKFGVHHAACAVFDVKAVGLGRCCGLARLAFDRVRSAHLLAHGDDLGAQRRQLARRGDDGAAHLVKTRGQRCITQHAAGACHGLVLPGPGGVAAALLLVVGIGRKADDQQTRAAIGPQGGVDLKQITFAGLDREPVDDLADQGRINLAGLLVLVFVNKHNVEVTAVTQLFAAQLAVGNDGELGRLAVAGFQALPAPVGGQAQHGFGQGAQIVGHLLNTEHALNVTRQCAKNFGVVGAAQQVQASLLVVFAGALQGSQPLLELSNKDRGVKALLQQIVAGQLVNHARVLQQITGRPLGRAQQAQQAFVYRRALQQHGQVTFAAQQRLDPVDQAQRRLFTDLALQQPDRGALHQPGQAGARVFAQGQHARVQAPRLQTGSKMRRPGGRHLRQQLAQLLRLADALVASRADLGAAQQLVKLTGHQLAVRIEFCQKSAAARKAQGAGDPGQVVVTGG